MNDTRPLIHVVDDHPLQLRFMEQLLSEHFQLRLFDRGEGFLQALALGPLPDLVLLDVVMPGINGYALCEQLKSDPRTASIPVMFLTGSSEPAAEVRGFALGAADYVIKPIRPAVLTARINAQLLARKAREMAQAPAADGGSAQDPLEPLLAMGLKMAAQTDAAQLLQLITFGARDIVHCECTTLWLSTEPGRVRLALRSTEGDMPEDELPAESAGTGSFVLTGKAPPSEPVVINDLAADPRHGPAQAAVLRASAGLEVRSLAEIGLRRRSGELVGIIQWLNALDASGQPAAFRPEQARLMQAMGAQATLAIENLTLLQDRRALMASVARALAGTV